MPGILHVVDSINLGAPGQQPYGNLHQVSVHGTTLSADNTGGSMCNHGAIPVAGGALLTIQQTYAMVAGNGN